jgi:hypothetical protein
MDKMAIKYTSKVQYKTLDNLPKSGNPGLLVNHHESWQMTTPEKALNEQDIHNTYF